jgi:hypothetical protein
VDIEFASNFENDIYIKKIVVTKWAISHTQCVVKLEQMNKNTIKGKRRKTNKALLYIKIKVETDHYCTAVYISRY